MNHARRSSIANSDCLRRDNKNRYIGAVSVGFGPGGKRLRRKVSGKTKQEVRDKLKALHAELDAGLQSSAGYTVQVAVISGSSTGYQGDRRGRSSCTGMA